jgi:hypothetical protein
VYIVTIQLWIDTTTCSKNLSLTKFILLNWSMLTHISLRKPNYTQ